LDVTPPEEDLHMRELQLIGAPASNFVWTVRLACTEKGVPYSLVPTTPHTPEVDAIHPFGKIPVLRHGDFTLAESRAICLYVDRAFDGPPLVPADVKGAAKVEQWLSLVNTKIDLLLVRRYLGAWFFPSTSDGSPDRQVIDAALAEMRAHFAVLDAAVGPTGYLANDSFTLADINLLPILFYMDKMPESRRMLADTKHLRGYFERHFQRPSVQRTVPESMPERFAQVLAQVA
jgi:glutathione S-transferase